MDNFIISWGTTIRLFRIADRLVIASGKLSYTDQNAYGELFNQLPNDKQQIIYDRFGKRLTFLSELKA